MASMDDHEPYDAVQPFDSQKLLDGFTVEERQVPADPDSPLGQVMAKAREAWAAPGYVPIDPETFTVEPIPVTDFGDVKATFLPARSLTDEMPESGVVTQRISPAVRTPV